MLNHIVGLNAVLTQQVTHRAPQTAWSYTAANVALPGHFNPVSGSGPASQWQQERRVNTASEQCWSIDVFARTHVPKLVCMHWMGPNKREVCRYSGIRERGDFVGC